MKLLIFIHSLHAGGAERVTANLANHWAEKGWQVTVVTLTSSTQDFYQFHPSIERIALDIAGESGGALHAIINNLRRIRALRQVLKHTQPDVSLAMMSNANILLAVAALGIKDMLTVGSEHIFPPRIPLGGAWEALRTHLYGQLDAMSALTQECALWLRQHTRARQIPVIPNPVPWPLPVQEPFSRRPTSGEITQGLAREVDTLRTKTFVLKDHVDGHTPRPIPPKEPAPTSSTRSG